MEHSVSTVAVPMNKTMDGVRGDRETLYESNLNVK